MYGLWLALAGAVEVRSGDLGPGDERLGTGEFVDRVPFGVAAGATVTLTLESSAFDTWLGAVAPGAEPIQNDDHEGSTSRSQITLTATTAGTLWAVVTSARAGEAGAWTLRVTGVSPSGVRQEGRLAAGDETLGSGEYIDRVRFQGQAGAPVTVRLRSAAFDPFLALTGPNGEEQQNDDAPDQDGSFIGWTLPATGTWTVAVTTYKPGESGAWFLETTGLTAEAALAGASERFRGELAAAVRGFADGYAAVRGSGIEGEPGEFRTSLTMEGASEVRIHRDLGTDDYRFIASYGSFPTREAGQQALRALVAKVASAPVAGFPWARSDSQLEMIEGTVFLPFGVDGPLSRAMVEVQLISAVDFDPASMSMRDTWLLVLRVAPLP